MSLTSGFEVYAAIGEDQLESLAPSEIGDASRESLRVALIQDSWHGSMDEQMRSLESAFELCKEYEPDLIILPELTLYPYACWEPNSEGSDFQPEELMDGPSYAFARKMARLTHASVVISLYEQPDDESELGYNSAITLSAAGELVMRTRKTHLPQTAGYYENTYFSCGDDGTPTALIGEAHVGIPTCWDQWFPELARAYALDGADIVIYPTAIGSEPNFPNFDTAPLWKATMVAHAIANGLFVGAVNRIGTEGPNTFYGSSFIADPFGRTLVEAGRSEQAILIADCELDQRRDWLTLFPFFKTRRPEMYTTLAREDDDTMDESGDSQ
ncbi:unannotated protein [freshwater metagenome]|jgi:N-carbamoylputrescine amidase|uniref:Unannotated protein n=1 Tax=freshwater metagenome TaxID=449393 RepID=A0A6J7B7K0_9ZZZZ|nr:hydrolase [Actinomycetota bacterium]MSX62888.1 hydrolase [Actinomycetota bacterium]MSY10510.1 hydrolase [Actinomycetota bacterium]MSZ68971.1 hydrolase [Actinomycetota bacterium]